MNRTRTGSESKPEPEQNHSPTERPLVETLTEQQLGLKQAEERLYRDYIHRLAKASPDYPNFQYLCRLCCVHIENVQGAHKHIKEKRHKKNITEKQEENELRALPAPSPAQIQALDRTVIQTAQTHGLSDQDFNSRLGSLQRMERTIQKHIPGCSLRMYGSCLTRFAFKSSDINIDVSVPPNMTQPEVLIQVLEILKSSPDFSEVESDFHAKVPSVSCRDVHSKLLCKVSGGNDVACLTTNHLAALSKLEPRLVPLVLAFRHWARLCHMDHQAEGGIPSYSLALMVIFFLQQRPQPVLPVYIGPWVSGFELKRVDEFHLTGICQEAFVRWEHRPPTETRSENQNKTESQTRTETRTETPPSEGLSSLTMSCPDSASVGRLWLDLLRFYTLEFALEDFIISIRVRDQLSRESKGWPRRRLAIEDPFALKRNVARSLNSQMVFEYVQERFRAAYKYFAVPQRPPRGSPRTPRTPRASRATRAGDREPHSRERAGDREPRTEIQTQNPDCIDCGLRDLGLEQDREQTNGLSELSELGESEEDEEELLYHFEKHIFTGGKPPVVVCSICKRDGHLKDECPEDFKKIELKPLPPMNQRFRDILDGLCRLCYHELSPTPLEQQKREQILLSLERFIRKEFNDKAQLCLFGSSRNGFGFRDSDLDICMTLEGHHTAEKLNCKEIIEGLAKVLKKHTGLRNILPITTAKVPIVKFEHRQSGLEGDISLYNTLAQHNTRMLATYAALDPRVQLLGYTMKVFAKRCDIGDASRGSLSSYAYILMVLYFLQQREPPVVPVLQEMFEGPTAPQKMVDGWNAFFFDDLQELRRRAAASLPNTESPGQLWLGLLRFYTEDFDFKEHVISIRQRKRLTTFEKQWTSKCIAIEDPFDLNHNLGAGVSRKMTNFIMKAFINGRKLFGTPFYPPPGTEVDYFLDSKVLTDGELAPNDRCCRICGKIGHYMKDCPKRRRVKKKEGEAVEEVREEEQRRCFQCGDTGHVRRDCPEYRHLKTRTNAQGGHLNQSGTKPGLNQDSRTRHNSECSESRQTPPSLSSSPQAFKATPLQQVALLGLAPPTLGLAPPPWPQTFKVNALNDPSIIFAQATANHSSDPVPVSGPSRRLWDPKPPQFSPSWRFPVPQPYGPAPFHQPGSMAPSAGSFPLLPHVRRGGVNMAFLPQKK